MENEEELLKEAAGVAPNAETSAAEETAVTAVADGNSEEASNEEKPAEEKPKKLTKLQQFLQLLKFTAFMISAGVIQFVSTGALSTWTNLIPYWIAYLIGLVLSVVWSFTFNRKFTFASAANVPLAMALVTVYYCMFIPVSVFGGDALEKAWGENLGIVVTVLMMIINFVTEFLWDKFLVFNDRVMKKIEGLFKRKKKDE